jgi:hypothetical protein
MRRCSGWGGQAVQIGQYLLTQSGSIYNVTAEASISVPLHDILYNLQQLESLQSEFLSVAGAAAVKAKAGVAATVPPEGGKRGFCVMRYWL